MRKHLPALFIFLLLVICVGFQIFQSDKSAHEEVHYIYDFPAFTQPDNITCGPTSTQMLLSWYGIDVDFNQIEKDCKTRWFSYQGDSFGLTMPDGIANCLTKNNIKSSVKRGSIENLKHYANNNRLPIVLLRSGPRYWHYVNIIGYDKDYIYISDPGCGKKYGMTIEHFIGAWSFKTDMCGKVCGDDCPICDGGKYYGTWTCDLCMGKGKLDPLPDVLAAATVFPNTMIVPERGRVGKE